MSSTTKGFDHYDIELNSGVISSARVYVRLFASGTPVATLAFKREDLSPGPPSLLSGGVPMLEFPMSSFDAVIATLRFEKPLSVVYDVVNKTGYVTTAIAGEPVGEQEGV